MEFSKRLPPILVLLVACTADPKFGPPPVDNWSTTSDRTTTSTEGSSSTTGSECAEGLERLLRWEDEAGAPAPTPANVSALYRLFDGSDEPVEEVGCGVIDDLPTCWVPCGHPDATSLIVEWECETRVHNVSEAPLPAIILFPGCAPGTSGTDTLGDGSSSGTGSSSTDTSGSSTDTSGSSGSSGDSSGSGSSTSSTT